MANIHFSSPFLRSFTHATVSVGLTSGVVLDAAVTPIRRVCVIVQNMSGTAILTVRFSETGDAGLLVQPNQSISLDNYNGHIRCMSDTAATPVHIAFATA